MSTGRERVVVFVTLLVGYASFYLCRSNVDAAFPFLRAEFGYDAEKLGRISSLGIFAYAIGKLVLGALGDVIGGKRIMLLAIVGSVIGSLTIGFTGTLFMLGACVMLNRFFQSGGWGGLVHVVSRWFPPDRYGTVMGGLSTSYEVGGVVSLVFCGLIVSVFGWRALFVVNPIVFAVIGVGVSLVLKGAPTADTEVLPGTGYRDHESRKAEAEPRVPLSEVLPHLARNPGFWFAVTLSFILTFVRTGFLTWTPLLLTDVARAGGQTGAAVVSGSIIKSAIFPACGIVAAITVGRLSDRFGPGKRAPVMAASLLVLVFAIHFLSRVGVHSTLLAVTALGACGLSLMGPYSLLGGACTLDVAMKKGTATAAGIIDGIGYLGGALSGVVIGTAVSRRGWAVALDLVAIAAAVGVLVSIAWWIEARRRLRKTATTGQS